MKWTEITLGWCYAAIFLLVLALSGCGGGGEDEPEKEPESQPAPIEWRKPPADPCLNTHPCVMEAK